MTSMPSQSEARKTEPEAAEPPAGQTAPSAANLDETAPGDSEKKSIKEGQPTGAGDAAAPAEAGSDIAPANAPESHSERPQPPRRSNFIRRIGRRWTRRSAEFLDYLSVDRERRRRASIVLAVAVNIILFTALAVFGRFHIWIPAAPKDSVSIVMLELPVEPVLPELREPEIAPVPEPEPEPEPVEELQIEPEPAPEPEPEPQIQPEAAREPEPAPSAPEPEPQLDLSPEPVFAPPVDEAPAPLVEEPLPVEEDLLEPIIADEAPAEAEIAADDPAPEDIAEQAPAAEAPPLVDPEPPAAAEPEIAADETVDDEPATNETAEKDEEPAAPEAPAPAVAEAPAANDDAFDEDPVFAPRATLPQVDLPEGAVAAVPGQSGVVAIFCPKEFANKDKAAECAGRTEIKSGWRPGASGEDWSVAIRLLKQDQAAGRVGVSPTEVFGPEQGQAMEDAANAAALRDFRRTVGRGVDNPAGQSAGNLNETLGQPSIGPRDNEPSWTLREDPNVDQKQVDKLKKALEEAERSRNPQPPPGEDN